jgi:adenylate kinase
MVARARECGVHIVLLGAPGSGKGTQGDLLAEHFGVPHVSSGELLRTHVAAGTDLGRQVAYFLSRGELVPDDLVLEAVSDALTGAFEAGGYVLDGIPRTLAQAERAYALAKEVGLIADAVIYLDVPDDVARERLAGRAETGRVDDADPAVIERRLRVFHADTRPLLDFYRERGILRTIDAVQPVDAVSNAILETLTGGSSSR